MLFSNYLFKISTNSREYEISYTLRVPCPNTPPDCDWWERQIVPPPGLSNKKNVKRDTPLFLEIGSFYNSPEVKLLSFTFFESIQPISGFVSRLPLLASLKCTRPSAFLRKK